MVERGASTYHFQVSDSVLSLQWTL